MGREGARGREGRGRKVDNRGAVVWIANGCRLAVASATVSQPASATEPTRPRFAAADWATAVRSGSAPQRASVGYVEPNAFVGAGLAEQLEVELPEGTPTDRILRYAISSDRPSRRGFVIKQEGLRFDTYHRQVLWGHDWCRWDSVPNPPIGRTEALSRDRVGDVTRTIAIARFAGRDQGYELAEMVYLLGRDNFIPDCSVGIDPEKWYIDEATDFLHVDESALLEFSLVPIGDNIDAVKLSAAVQGYGLDWRPYVESVEALLDTLPAQRGMYISQSKSEAFLGAMGLLGKVTFSGLLELGPQLLAARSATTPVVGRIREDASEPPAETTTETPAEEVATETTEEVTTTEAPSESVPGDATSTEAPIELSREQCAAAVTQALQSAFLSQRGTVVYLENTSHG